VDILERGDSSLYGFREDNRDTASCFEMAAHAHRYLMVSISVY